MSESVADKVRRAADYIDRVGLHKGAMVEEYGLWPGSDTPEILERGVKCCTVGALSVFDINTDEVRLPLAKKVGVYRTTVDTWGTNAGAPIEYDDLPDWNDAPERTKEDVVTALRELADELEQGAALTE